MMRWFHLIWCIPWLGAAACSQISEANGSFEESENSGRIKVPGVDSRRFFRFHLRQFGDEVGGTFESFDMSNYSSFSHVPLYMNSALNLYYCARIDQGYVRGDMVHVLFTDREQRQWIFSAALGREVLSGTLLRMNHARDGESFLRDPDYLMPEDAAYYRQSGGEDNDQIIMEPMDRSTDDSLNCLYYFRRFDVNFMLPADFPFDQCNPSTRQCHQYRLAIVGTRPQRRILDSHSLFYAEIQSAYLDDCDIQPGPMRTMVLRDNPFVITGMTPGLFIATAIVYEDINENGFWDSEAEPVLAALSDESLVFYETAPESAVYGSDSAGGTYQIPVLAPGDIDPEPGWHAYRDESEIPEKPGYLRVLRHLGAVDDNTMVLLPTSEDFRGCMVSDTETGLPRCDGVLPLLIQ